MYVDGSLVKGPAAFGRLEIPLQPVPPVQLQPKARRVDLAINVGLADGPVASASSSDPAAPASEAIDGRLWFFPEIANGWSPLASDQSSSWYAIDFGHSRTLSSVELYFFSDGESFKAPEAFHLQYQAASGWQDVPLNTGHPEPAVANGETEILFSPLTASKVRVVLSNPAAPARVRLIEVKAFAPAAKSEPR